MQRLSLAGLAVLLHVLWADRREIIGPRLRDGAITLGILHRLEDLPVGWSDAVQEAAAEATALQRKLAQESDDKMFAELKAKGVQIDKVDQGPFMAATAPVIAKWEASPIGPFVKKVVAAARAK